MKKLELQLVELSDEMLANVANAIKNNKGGLKTVTYPTVYEVTESQRDEARLLVNERREYVINKHKNNLLFRGMGWSKAEGTNDVGNPRIRTQFKNKKGREFFVEFINNSKGNIYVDFSIDIDLRNRKESIIDELFEKVKDFKEGSEEKRAYYKKRKEIEKDMYEYNYRGLERNKDIWSIPYTKENILDIVNSYFDCYFKQMHVDNYLIGVEGVICENI